MRIEIKYGLLIGTGIVVWVFFEFLFGFHGQRIAWYPLITNLAFLVIQLIGLFLALREKSIRSFNKHMPFWEGVKSGGIISAISGLLLAGFMVIYFRWINPGWTDFMTSYARQRIMTKTSDSLVIAQAADQARTYFGFHSFVFQSFLGMLIGGILISLIFCAFLKRKKIED